MNAMSAIPKQEPTTPNLPGYGLQQPSRAGKVPKPLMEKRRRARINKCLEELKVLVPDLTESGTRVDKADVLEMTVEHLTRMRNSKRNLTSNLTPHVVPYVNPQSQYKQGYQQCMSEVTKILLSASVDDNVTHRLMEHLGKRTPPVSTTNLPTTPTSSTHLPATPVSSTHLPVNNRGARVTSNGLVVPEPLRSSPLTPHFAFTPMQYATYPSPPNSPVETPPRTVSPPALADKTHLLAQMMDRTNMTSLLSSLPSIARRPLPRATSVWRPWSEDM